MLHGEQERGEMMDDWSLAYVCLPSSSLTVVVAFAFAFGVALHCIALRFCVN